MEYLHQVVSVRLPEILKYCWKLRMINGELVKLVNVSIGLFIFVYIFVYIDILYVYVCKLFVYIY